MVRSLRFAALACLLAAAVSWGCATGEDDAAAQEQAREQTWSEIQQAKEQLDARRAELAGLQEKIESGDLAEGESAEDLEARAKQLGGQLEQEAGDLYNRLVEYINSDPPVQGEPMTERQQAAVRMKGDEDIILAREYIDKGGDYARAIQIYQDALLVDPDNERLQAELAKAEEMRYVTRERFDQLKKGMTQAQVVEVLGRPHHRNVRAYEDRGVTAWFYPKGETRSAAAVWFRDKKVYDLNFDAVQGQDGEAG